MIKLLRFLGSLSFAVSLISGLALILTVSTVAESALGTPFVQKNFYSAHWFDFFLGLVWINIFFSTLSRWPFKRRHVGFVITHIGILILLVGALLTRLLGAEGQLTVFENNSQDFMIQSGHTLRVSQAGGKDHEFSLRSKSDKLPFPILLPEKDPLLFISEILEKSEASRWMTEGGPLDPQNFAVQLSFTSDKMGFHESAILIEKDLDDPKSAQKSMGPATVILKTGDPDQDSQKTFIHLSQKGKELPLLAVEELTGKKTPLPGTDLTLYNLRYYPHAKVVDKKITESPLDTPFNPAVEFEVEGPQGKKEFHTKFLIFPDFPSVRGGKSSDHFGLEAHLETEDTGPLATPKSPTLILWARSGQPWFYRAYSSKGLSSEGPLETGQKIQTGWNDITIQPLKMFDRAIIAARVKKTEAGKEGAFAIKIEVQHKEDIREFWVTENFSAQVPSDKGPIRIALKPSKYPLPFDLTLKDFRRIDYPGTSTPSAYESDVVLKDAKKNVRLEKTISMNKPLDYAGYRIFQSSYIQDEELGEASVFTVAKNPGISLIYGGASLILVGVILLFYFHPFFNRSLEKRV